MKDEKHIDEISGTETTGHEWDGIKELNTPMPRWWLWMFYGSIIWAIGYAILMPAIPALPGMQGYTKGVIGYSDRAAVAEDMDSLIQSRSGFASRLTGASIETIQGDEELFTFAMAAGKSAFGDNCATCHGTGAQGFKGYPNLNDDIWLWGGSFDDIKKTLNYGIRSDHEESRISLMQAYGRDGLLEANEIDDLVQYILDLSGQDADQAAALRAGETYMNICSSCHGTTGKGDRMQGAPNLTDAQLDYAASDVLYLHKLKEKFDILLARESRTEVAQSCFDFLPTRAKLDLAGWPEADIFSH